MRSRMRGNRSELTNIIFSLCSFSPLWKPLAPLEVREPHFSCDYFFLGIMFFFLGLFFSWYYFFSWDYFFFLGLFSNSYVQYMRRAIPELIQANQRYTRRASDIIRQMHTTLKLESKEEIKDISNYIFWFKEG